MSDLYDADIVIWSKRQSALLRRRAAGELVNEADIDWSNVAEEIEDVGRGELRSCRSLLRQALRHLLKAEAWPQARDARDALPETVDGQPPLHVPEECAVTFDELLSDGS